MVNIMIGEHTYHKETILIVDDEKDIIDLIKYNLIKENYNVIYAQSCEEGLKIIDCETIDLILLDLMLPGMNGFEFTKELKNNLKFKEIPIIMLTAKTEESDIVIGLGFGADDYITKPFSPKILIARIKAVLRRRQIKQADYELKEIKVGEISIDVNRRKVFLSDNLIEYSEFEILSALINRPGVIFTRYQLLDMIKGTDYNVTERSIDVQIVGLRKKLGKFSHYIETVRGVGYRFK